MMDRSAQPDASTEAASAEELLVRGLRAGDASSYEKLVRTYAGRMLAVARRLLGNDEDAQDALQDAFVSAFRAIEKFSGQARIGTWLHRIVVNAALMKLRRRKSRPEQPIETLLPGFLPDGHAARPAAEWRQTAHEALQQSETRAFVRECIAQLPETYRVVLQLRDIDELDTEETASLLGIQPNAVKTRLHRARQALRTLLDQRLRGDP
jgi:RNA polymerase sigma-70 factor (ECF subfamily)